MEPFYTEKASGFEPHHDPTLSMTRSMRSMNHHTLGDRTSCISSAAEVDGKLRNPQRRRVPVACKRCRKRKIKCSGDSGDGQGCSNCRSAGNTDCQFLRVNSQPVNEGWPYPCMGAKLAPSSGRGAYTPHSPVKPTVLSIEAPQPHVALFQRHQEFDLSAAAEGHLFPRPGVGMDGLHYEDEQPANYGQTSAYLLPNTSSGPMLGYAPSSWGPKSWDAVYNTHRVSAGGIYSEPEANASNNTSPFTYVLPSQSLPSSNLPHPISATTSADSPPDSLGSNRTLPTPTCRGQQVPSTTTGLSLFQPEGSPGLNLASDFKSSFWNPRCGSSPDERPTTTHTIPSNLASFANSPPSQKSASSTSTTADLVFTYLPMSTSTDENTSLSSSASLASSTTTAGNPPYLCLDSLASQSDYKALPSDARLTRSFSRDHSSASSQRLLAMTDEFAPDIYGYTSSEKSRARVTANNDSRCSAATLMNGLPYTRVRHSEPSASAFSFNLLPDALPEYHRVVENVHRPVEPLGNHGAY